MAHFEKYYTVEEANAQLPELRELLQSLREIRDHLVISWESATPVLEAVPNNGGGVEANPYLQDILRLNRQVRRLSEKGILLKDLDKGLVDFPAWRGDREVFLCWHQGEDTVAFWHDLQTGYAGRKPV